jgi:glycosyltransferase involved in cell wall biosynthesis
MPYHGDPGLFRDAVRSVLAQTDPAWTLHVIEDGSNPDFDTAAWLGGLDHPRVTYARNPERLGVCGNFQRCLDSSTGPYVVFLGCDDIMLPDYVRTVRRLIARFPAADVLLPGVAVIDSAGDPAQPLGDRIKRAIAPRLDGPAELRGERLLASLMHGNWTYFPAFCWRRESIASRGFRSDLPTTLDLELLSQVLIGGGAMALDPTVVFHYRRHAESASSRTAASLDRFDEEARLLEELAAQCRSVGWSRAARAARWRVTSRLHRFLVHTLGPVVA